MRLLAGRFLAVFMISLALTGGAWAGPVSVYFSPGGGVTDAIVHELGQAKSTVYVQAYSFTSAPIAKALSDAAQRGVQVRVILDKSNISGKYGMADFLRNHGIIPLIDSKHAIAHNKIMILDKETVITGSFNFTKAAENSNAENLIIIHDADLAAKYLHNWDTHAEHSAPYEGRSK